MYEVRLLPVAAEDFGAIAGYTTNGIESEAAAELFLADFERSVSALSTMPFRRWAYVPLRPLEHECRALAIGSHLAICWVEEEPRQVVTIARVLYARFDHAKRFV